MRPKTSTIREKENNWAGSCYLTASASVDDEASIYQLYSVYITHVYGSNVYSCIYAVIVMANL